MKQNWQLTEAVIGKCPVKKVFLEILQNLPENICARVSLLIKLQASTLQLYWKIHPGPGVFKKMFFGNSQATASKHNATFKKLFSLIEP